MAVPSIIWATVVSRAAKKMLAFRKKFLNSDGELPSGTNEDDVDKFILDMAYLPELK